MLSIQYEDWENICKQVFIQNRNRKKMYLQWYPFTCLSSQEKDLLCSEEFFNEFIKNGVFTYYPENWIVADNYLMKGDGNFRNATLISPIMYLLALSIGKSIAQRYRSNRPADISVYYAGNLNEDRLYYQAEYDKFYKELNMLSEEYTYFIKTDVKDFFCNINLNKLFQMLDTRLTKIGKPLTQRDIMLYKELLQCFGKGEFPLIENSALSSYLSTVVYLEDVDSALYSYLRDKESAVTEFKMVRYVDDLYILFNSSVSKKELTPFFNRVVNQLSSGLKSINLTINRNKTVWKVIEELSSELKQSFYDEQVNGKKFKIYDLLDDEQVFQFLGQVESELRSGNLVVERYKQIIQSSFSIDAVEYTPEEVFNNLVYEKHTIFQQKRIADKLYTLIEFDYRFLKLDTKRLMVMLLKTKNERTIKLMLSKLFETNRNGTWNIYDTSLTINYLLQRGFENKDLINILKQQDQSIYQYYTLFCKQSFLKTTEESRYNWINVFNRKGFYKKDDILFFLSSLYVFEREKKNYLNAFAYFKNFFDRISAHLALAINGDEAKGKPNYKAYYKEGAFIKLYAGINCSDDIIGKAHKLRNANPLAHSSAGLIDDENTAESITKSIESLSFLIEEKVKELL